MNLKLQDINQPLSEGRNFLMGRLFHECSVVVGVERFEASVLSTMEDRIQDLIYHCSDLV